MKLHSNRRSYEKRRRLPKNAESRNPKVLIGSLAAIVISAVALCMVVIIGIVGFSSGGTKTVSGTVSTSVPVHAWFFTGSDEGKTENDSFTMDGVYFQEDGVSYLPVDGAAAALGGTAVYDKDKGTVKFKNIGKRAKVTVGSDAMKASLFKRVTLSAPVMEKDGVVYVPVRDFFEGLNYGVTYSSPSKRLDIFAKSSGKDQPPTASFTTDKDTYNVGEKIAFTVDNSSPQGYEIVEEKWENKADWYFESGEVTIAYSVKDYRGNWSETVSKTITVEGEYEAAATVPVLSYYYITPNSDNISKVVKKEKKTKEMQPDPNDPTGVKQIEVEKSEWYNETVRGPFYGDEDVISLDQFRDEMEILADSGCNPITVSECLDYLDSGVMPPVNSVIILFVNGYESTYRQAYPVLKEYGFKANIAASVKLTEERSVYADGVAGGVDGAQDQLDEFDDGCRFPYLTFAEINEMVSESGFEIGAVSYDSNRYGDNAALLAAPTGEESEEEYEERVKEDVASAKAALDNGIESENREFFVYPYGEFSDFLVDTLKANDFTSAFTEDAERITDEWSRFYLPRFRITQSTNSGRFGDLIY